MTSRSASLWWLGGLILTAPVILTAPALQTVLAEPEILDPTALVGNWICREGPCLDEEIQFAVEDGEPVYNSWLHARPSASGGTWSLEGDRLTITCCGRLEMTQIIVELGESTLRLRDSGEDETKDNEAAETAVYSRVE